MYLSRLLYPDKSLPLLLDAQDGPLAGRSVSSLTGWIADHRDLFESWLAKHGAVLLRGFAIDTPQELESVVEAVQPKLLNYVEGDSPRTKITGKVYTSTEYPETYQISLHNELSYAHKWPRKIFFYCAHPPSQGGETPIVDCREVLQVLDPQTRERFVTRKVKYEWINDLLSYDRIKRQGYFNPDVIETLKARYSKDGFKLNFPFESDLLNVVLTFGIFLDLFKMPNLR